MVVVFHAFGLYNAWFGYPSYLTVSNTDRSLSPAGKVVNDFVNNLDLGVEFFFLISGFLITYLLLHEKGKTGRVHIGQFYIRRVLRIWPLYFLIVALAPWWVSYCGEKEPDYWATALFVNNFNAIAKTEWQFPFAHFWSVCVEEHFYLFWPLIIGFVPVRRLPYVFSGLILVSIAYRGMALLYLNHWNFQVLLHTLSRMDVLVIGAWIAYRHYHRPIVLHIGRSWRIGFYLLSLLAFCFLQNKQWELTPSLGLVFFWKYIFVAIFVFAFCNYLFNPDAFFNFKKKNPLHYLGKISFGIYMYHNVLFTYMVKDVMWKYGTQSSLVYWSVYLGILIVLSVLSYELYEKWFLRLKDRFAIIRSRNDFRSSN